MNRIAVLLAMIAFAVMSTAMAPAQPMAMSMAPMQAMPHSTAMPDMPCSDSSVMACDMCCIMIPALAARVHMPIVVKPGFAPIASARQVGRIVPPALPPPRSVRDTI